MCPLFSRKACLYVGIALLTAAMPLRAGESARGKELREKLSDTIDYPGLEDPRATLTDVLDDLTRRYGLTLEINEKAFGMDDLKEVKQWKITEKSSIPSMRGAKLGRVLRSILSRLPAESGAAYLIRDDAIEITTMAAIRKEFFADRPTTPGPLPPLVSGTFDKVPLDTALKELNHYGNVVLDPRTGKDAEALVAADFSNVPLDTAVSLLADMAGLGVVQLDNVFYVTTKDNANALMKERQKHRRQQENDKKTKPSTNEEKLPGQKR